MNFFHYRCYGWGTTSEYWLEVGVYERVGQFGPKFQVEGDVPSNHSYITKVDALIMQIVKNLGWSFVRFVTIHAFVGRTNGRTDGRLYDHQYCVAYNAGWKRTSLTNHLCTVREAIEYLTTFPLTVKIEAQCSCFWIYCKFTVCRLLNPSWLFLYILFSLTFYLWGML